MEARNDIKVKINDVTLREWDQAPLTSFIADEKKLIALMLKEVWVYSIEAGFASSRAEFDNVRWVVELFIDDDNAPVITSLWRAVKEDTKASLEVLEGYKNWRVHIVMATSDEHIQAKFPWKWDNLEERRRWVMKAIINNIALVKKYKDEKNSNLEIEFSPEDATGNALTKKENWKRYLDFESDDFKYLIEVIRNAIQAWANIINTPDTLWNFLPHQSEKFFQELVKRTEGLKKDYNFEFSTHIHNDMASATNGAIAWVRWWARQIEVTTAGIWERAWNTSLHEVVWIIENAWHNIADNGEVIFHNKIQTQLIWPVTRFVERVLNLNKWLQTPFIWALSDVDGSGIHTAAVNVYGWTKNKADFWGLDMEEFFSPRSWANQIVNILSNKYSINADKNSEVIQRVTTRACKEAETVKALYPARIYTLYLEEARGFKINDININWNHINIKMMLWWEEIVIEWTWKWENGIVDATVQAINSYIWKDSVDVASIEVKNKASLTSLYDSFLEEVSQTSIELSQNFKERAMKVLWDNNGSHWSEQVWVVHMTLKIDGKEVNIRAANQNIDSATVKAILYWAMGKISR